MTSWFQKRITLSPQPRGFHLVTDEVLSQLPELTHYQVGIAHLFLQHTSASLALNERVEPEVRADLAHYFDRIVPEDPHAYTHQYEGPDDMPAHIKTVLLGSTLTLPITNGRFNLGRWQGIYLCEHRNHGGARTLVVTLSGESK